MRVAAAIAAVALAGGCGDRGSSSGPAGSTGTDVLTYSNGHPLRTASDDPGGVGFEDELHRLTNDHRVALGLAALVDHLGARETARAHSRHMSIHEFFAHENPEGDDPGERLERAGVPWLAAGENIAAGQDSARAAFDAWLASPGHRRNIEDPGWTHAGMGFWSGGGAYGTYYTQNFLVPR